MAKLTSSEMEPQPTARGIVLALGLGCVLTLFAVEGVLRLAMPHWRDFYSGWFMHNVRVPDHGILIMGRPGFDGYFAQNNGDFRVRITVNDFGLRNPDPVEVANNRVWFVGDSMTFGWGVEQNEIYSTVAGRLLKTPTYNVASPGTNACGYQALVARMPKAIRPKAMIVGLILENDITDYDCRTRGKNTPEKVLADHQGFRTFLIENTALYNFLAVSLKRVGFIRKTLVSLGLIRQSHAYSRQLSEAQIASAAKATADELKTLRSMLPAGAPFAVLIAPGRFEIRDGDHFFRKLRNEVTEALVKNSIPVIDPIEKFLSAGFQPTHFPHDGHWSPLGHELAGRAAARWLRRQGI